MPPTMLSGLPLRCRIAEESDPESMRHLARLRPQVIESPSRSPDVNPVCLEAVVVVLQAGPVPQRVHNALRIRPPQRVYVP